MLSASLQSFDKDKTYNGKDEIQGFFASLRMTTRDKIKNSDYSRSLRDDNQKAGNSKINRRSFDYAADDETVSSFAQDDNSLFFTRTSKANGTRLVLFAEGGCVGVSVGIEAIFFAALPGHLCVRRR